MKGDIFRNNEEYEQSRYHGGDYSKTEERQLIVTVIKNFLFSHYYSYTAYDLGEGYDGVAEGQSR